MDTYKTSSIIDFAPALQPVAPVGGASKAAGDVLNRVLDITDLSGILREIADQFADEAPASAAHVLDLSAALARTVLDWIEAWPS